MRAVKGEIVVASRIVDYLSSGLYNTPAACLKELVNNSYDADAALVEVFIKPDADQIIVADDGSGMTYAEFRREFSRISESHKREDSDTTVGGRPKVGKIGIGFIAANELCEQMQILSTRDGSEELLDVTIDFESMRQDLQMRRRRGGAIAKGDYAGVIRSAARSAHYTRIFLKRIRGPVKAVLAGASRAGRDEARSLYGLLPGTIRGRLCRVDSWDKFDAYSETQLGVALNVPVAYHDNWIPQQVHQRVRRFEKLAASLDFRVQFDGTDLRKPIVFCPPTTAVLVSQFEYQGESVSASGYFYAQHGTIRPQQLNGLLIRIRNAAVGEYDSSFLDFPPSIGPLFQRWISAEIWTDDGLEDAMNIDRRTLRVTHPAYLELQTAVHQHLRQVVASIREELYEAGSGIRKAKRSADIREQIRSVINETVAERSPQAAEAVMRRLDREPSDRMTRELLRTRSTADVYQVVAEVAAEVLAPPVFTRFMTALNKRLLGDD